MAKKSKKEKKDKKLNQVQDGEDNKFAVVIITTLIILIWLGIFALLIKLDIGGFGSTVLSPILKDVPVIKEILPDTTDEETTDSSEYPYKSLAEAVTYIKELELEIQKYQESDSTNQTKIAELTAEVTRLKTFEDNQTAFNELKSEFDNEVVFNENAPDISEYQKYYESIDPTNAEAIYKQVLEQQQEDAAMADYAKTYSAMKPAEAASVFLNMTDNMDTVVSILNSLSATKRGEILGALSQQDAAYAAKITQLLAP